MSKLGPTSQSTNGMNAIRLVETILMITAVILLWFLYTPIASLSGLRNVNYASSILIPLNIDMVYWSWLYTPYVLTFILVPVVSIFIVIKNYPNQQLEQKIVFIYLGTIVTSFIIYYLLPTNVPLIKKIPPGAYEPGYMNNLVLESYRFITPWNSFPAMHISTAWIPYRFFYIHKKYSFPYLVWFVLMSLGAMSLNYHSLSDVLAGIVIVELAFIVFDRYQEYVSRFFNDKFQNKRIAMWSLINLMCILIIYYSWVRGLFVIVPAG